MLTRETFATQFGGPRAIFGMVHLLPLPGAPLFGGSLDRVIDAALRDARAICDGGCDGVVFENFGDRPFFKSRVEAVTIAAMTRVIAEVVRGVRLPFGVNVLRNDARAALAIAAATGAAFIRVNVHSGVMYADQGMIEGEAAETLRLRAETAPNVAIFADHFVKHALPPAGTDQVQAAKDLRHRGLADALIVSGAETGAAPDADRLRLVREAAGDAPILIGSGLSAENAEAFADADGAIVGTAIKRDGRVDEPVERQRAERLVDAFKRAGR
jgi:membrane complex biogenesis BtpA family protein